MLSEVASFSANGERQDEPFRKCLPTTGTVCQVDRRQCHVEHDQICQVNRISERSEISTGVETLST